MRRLDTYGCYVLQNLEKGYGVVITYSRYWTPFCSKNRGKAHVDCHGNTRVYRVVSPLGSHFRLIVRKGSELDL